MTTIRVRVNPAGTGEYVIYADPQDPRQWIERHHSGDDDLASPVDRLEQAVFRDTGCGRPREWEPPRGGCTDCPGRVTCVPGCQP